ALGHRSFTDVRHCGRRRAPSFSHTTCVSFASTLSFQRYSRWDSSPPEASLSGIPVADLFGDIFCPFAGLACHKFQRNHCDNRISIHLAPPLGAEHRNEAHPVGTPTGHQHRGAPPEASAPIRRPAACVCARPAHPRVARPRRRSLSQRGQALHLTVGGAQSPGFAPPILDCVERHLLLICSDTPTWVILFRQAGVWRSW